MEHQKTENPFSEHLLGYRNVEKSKLILSLTITLVVMIIEFLGGIFTNSIALISDAGHMFTHSFAIAISLVAVIIARNPPCHHRTFGLYRAEILAAFINGLFLLLVVAVIIYEAILRLIYPLEILAIEMLIIAFVGLAVNVTSIFILHGSKKNDLNIQGLFYHMIADASSSIGIIIAAIIIFLTGWSFLDPLVSLFISLVILRWAWVILKESSTILLEMTPSGLNINILKDDITEQFPMIDNVDNIHLWSITPDMRVFTAHVTLNPSNQPSYNQDNLIFEISNFLCKKYDIIETTIQIEGTKTSKNQI
ncbi:MAG: cation diffusion facilitator family transporter [Candidatus Hodarchaeota archaeon]